MQSKSKRLIGVLAAVLAILAACGSTSDSSTSGSAAEVPNQASVEDSGGESAAEVDLVESDTPDAGGVGADVPDVAALAGRSLIRTGTVNVRADDVPSGVAEAKRAVAASGGFVASERTELADDFPSAEIVFRVPPGQYDSFTSKLGDIGEVTSQVSNTDDVTDQLIDLTARIANARASVERMRELFDRAETVTELAQLESELSRREADLERLEASRAGIDDQVNWSTITLRLFSDPDIEVADDSPKGFTDGLRTGWDALIGFLNGVAIVVGVLLPWTPLFALGLALAWWVRRRMRARAARRPKVPVMNPGWVQGGWQQSPDPRTGYPVQPGPPAQPARPPAAQQPPSPAAQPAQQVTAEKPVQPGQSAPAPDDKS